MRVTHTFWGIVPAGTPRRDVERYRSALDDAARSVTSRVPVLLAEGLPDRPEGRS